MSDLNLTNAIKSGGASLPASLELEIGSSVTTEERAIPNFEDKTTDWKKEAENANFLRLRSSRDKFFLNLSVEQIRQLNREEDNAGGTRIFLLNVGRRGENFDFEAGRLPVTAGRTFGLIDGLKIGMRAQDAKNALTLFGGKVPEAVTQKPGKKTAWGASGRIDWINFSFHEVNDKDRKPEKRRVTFDLTDKSREDIEIRAANEYDLLNKKFTKNLLGADWQISHRWGMELTAQKTDPAFEPGSFFNLIPSSPYFKYTAEGRYERDNFNFSLSGGQTQFKGEAVVEAGAEMGWRGLTIGGLLSKGSDDPYLNFNELHGGCETNIKNRASVGINGSYYTYNNGDLSDNTASQINLHANYEFAENWVIEGTGTARRNADGASEPLYSLKLTYYFSRVFGEKNK